MLQSCDATRNNCHIVAYFGVTLQRIRSFPMLVPQQLSIWIACNDPAADSALYSFHRTLRSFQKLFILYEIHSKKNWWLWLCDGVLLLTVHMQYRKNEKWKRKFCADFPIVLWVNFCMCGFFLAYFHCQSKNWRSWCHAKSLEPVYFSDKKHYVCGCAFELFIRA